MTVAQRITPVRLGDNRTPFEHRVDNAIASLVAYRSLHNDAALLDLLKALSPIMPGDELWETIQDMERDAEPCPDCRRVNLCQCDQRRDDLMSMDTHVGWNRVAY